MKDNHKKKIESIKTLVQIFDNVAKRVEYIYSLTDGLIGQIETNPSAIGFAETSEDVRQGKLQSYFAMLDKAKDLLMQFASYSKRIALMVKQLQYKPTQLPDWLTEWVMSAAEARKTRLEKRKQPTRPIPYWLQKELTERERRQKKRLIEWKQHNPSGLPEKKRTLGDEDKENMDEWLSELLSEDLNKKIVVGAVQSLSADKLFDDIMGSLYSLYDEYFTIDGPVKEASDSLLYLYGVGSGNTALIKNWADHINIVTELFGGVGQSGSIFDGFRDGFIKGFETYVNTANSILSRPKVLDMLSGTSVEQQFSERQEELQQEKITQERKQKETTVLSAEAISNLQTRLPDILSDFEKNVTNAKDKRLTELENRWEYLKELVIRDVKAAGYSLDNEFSNSINVVEEGIRSRLSNKKVTMAEISSYMKIAETEVKEYCEVLLRDIKFVIENKINESVNWEADKINVVSLLKHYSGTNRLKGDLLYYLIQADDDVWKEASIEIRELFKKDMTEFLKDVQDTVDKLEIDLKSEVEGLRIDIRQTIG